VARNHFQNLFTQQSEVATKSVEEFLEHIPKIITIEENNELFHLIEEAEIKNVIWSLELNKEPSLNKI
jgi:hypothetical protein